MTKLTVALEWEPNANYAGADFIVPVVQPEVLKLQGCITYKIWLPGRHSNESPASGWPVAILCRSKLGKVRVQ